MKLSIIIHYVVSVYGPISSSTQLHYTAEAKTFVGVNPSRLKIGCCIQIAQHPCCAVVAHKTSKSPINWFRIQKMMEIENN